MPTQIDRAWVDAQIQSLSELLARDPVGARQQIQKHVEELRVSLAPDVGDRVVRITGQAKVAIGLIAGAVAWTPVSTAPQGRPASEVGTVRNTTVTDPKVIAAARVVAETYWKAQRTSDEKLFRSVTPQENMSVVFGWAFVRESTVQSETAEIAPLRDDLRECLALGEQARQSRDVSGSLDKQLEASRKALAYSKKAAEYARKIAVQNPLLGDLLQKSYTEAITPETFVESKSYTLMTYEYITDVDLQSRAGTSLKRRVRTLLRRLVVDSHDSGWKVFFVPGMD